MIISHPVPCIKRGYSDKLCWLSALAGSDDNMERQEDILVCNECADFRETISRGFGRRAADIALGTTIAKLLGQVSERNIKLEETRQELEKKMRQLGLIKTITDAVVRTADLSRALKIILTGVTSGHAFGFNRAAIFLVDQRKEHLEGRDAVGPESLEDAATVWGELQSISFEQQINNILKAPVLKKDYLSKLAEQIWIPLSDSSNFMVKALWTDKPIFFRKNEIDPATLTRILKHIDFNEFVVVPLQAEGAPLGLMVADNFYTNVPITEASMDALATLANTCTSVLEITLLHGQLSLRLNELERVNRLLRENQSYLLQAERLVHMGRLAATVAHEFKTPLVTIGGHARRALRNIGTPKFKIKDIEIIISEIERLEKITSEVLEYSRPSKFDIKSHSFNDLVKESLEILENKFQGLNVTVKSNFESVNPKIDVDERRLKQVIFNIIDNALEAMNTNETLIIETRLKSGYAVLDVTDTGVGIPDEICDKIFALFFTTKSRGSGLGLPVSKKIVEDHGGFIEFESTAGRGTRFSVYMPLAGSKKSDRE